MVMVLCSVVMFSVGSGINLVNRVVFVSMNVVRWMLYRFY